MFLVSRDLKIKFKVKLNTAAAAVVGSDESLLT